MKIYPSKKEFLALAKKYNTIPIVTEISADAETPVSVFKKVCRDRANSVLLESYINGEYFDRYSFICFDPSAVFYVTDNIVKIQKGDFAIEEKTDNPIDYLKKYLKQYNQAPIDGLPEFSGGFVGYLGYEMVKYCDTVKMVTKNKDVDYDAILMLAGKVIVFDNVRNVMLIINNAMIGHGVDEGKLYHDSLRENKAIKEKIKTIIGEHNFSPSLKPDNQPLPQSNFSKDEFISAVKKVKQYIVDGDVVQTVISQKFQEQIKGDTFNLYRTLRAVNPSRYMFYMNFGEVKLVGSSPEILVKLQDGNITLRPIAGTTKRTGSAEQDKKLAETMQNDPKERAEHVMMVDLGRNDVGRVSKPHTVKVTEYMVVERFSHVQHLVSNVIGKVRKGLTAFEIFKACFPAGTLTGAPKIRAMEIINELEPCARGAYGGAAGFFGFNGNMDVCIIIRTIIIKNNMASIQVGAGIVADSDPEKEYEETLRKAAGSFSAIDAFLCPTII